MDTLIKNAADIESDLAWLQCVLNARLRTHQEAETPPVQVLDVAPPDLSSSGSEYARFVRRYQLSFAERLAVILALAPHLRPQLLDPLSARNPVTDRRYSEFGGLLANGEGGLLPTGETLAFLIAGNDLSLRLSTQMLFDPMHFFAKENLLQLAVPGDDLPVLRGLLRISDDLLARLTVGQRRRPQFSATFPAQLVETKLTFEDVILPPATRRSVEEIMTWLEHGRTLMEEWNMAPQLRPGYRSLFYGPPGTGKTLTACLLGKATGRDVYKVDLSLVMSKYIGETEKNLGRIFDAAEHKGWLLFFDEADALFGKRSDTRDAHDRYANQEVSFLLQRIESFDGVVILASNLRDNIDAAFLRRFESVIHFPMPRPEERAQIWQRGFSPKAKLDASVDLDKLARDHVLTGGGIMNVIRYVSLLVIKEGSRPIAASDLLSGIRREYDKEGKG